MSFKVKLIFTIFMLDQFIEGFNEWGAEQLNPNGALGIRDREFKVS